MTLRACIAVLSLALLAGCDLGGEASYPDHTSGRKEAIINETGSAFGPEGLQIFGSGEPEAEAGATGIGVNSFLWRASLDTISFMPLASADPFGGVIITDWYSPPEADSERFKVTVYILGRDLRADGVRASVFRQVHNGNGAWSDAKVEDGTAVDLENAILTRARQLRVAGLE